TAAEDLEYEETIILANGSSPPGEKLRLGPIPRLDRRILEAILVGMRVRSLPGASRFTPGDPRVQIRDPKWTVVNLGTLTPIAGLEKALPFSSARSATTAAVGRTMIASYEIP